MNRVSSIEVPFVALVLLLSTVIVGAAAGMDQVGRDPQKLFEAGDAALRAGKLEEAERDFRQVLEINPEVAAAYVNLGVIYMRRKQWPQALEMLHKAEKLAPDMAGIRLNIGLTYFRQNDFVKAIKPFESVVRESPDSYQAHYLLGLCYFFNDRWADAISILEPLWAQSSNQLNYLYVLDVAAYKTKNSALEEKAGARLVDIGEGSPEFHLLMGKAHLNRGEYDDAIKELNAAAQADPKLPFVHFNLGLAYLDKQDYDHARDEFHKDIAFEPDEPFSYEQLGSMESIAGHQDEAAKNYRAALKLDPRSTDALMGLARTAEQQHHYALALSELDQVIRLNDADASAHYLRGQVLVRMGREKEGKEEYAAATKIMNSQPTTGHKKSEAETVPSPELAREPE